MNIADELRSEIEYQAKDMTLPARRIARQQAYDTARNTPILGEAMEIKQHVDLISKFGKLLKKKDKDTDKEENEEDNTKEEN